MRRLDLYILAELVGPVTLGFLIYTFILIFQVLFKSAELIINAGVEAATIGQLLLLSLPSIVVLTIPMSLLFGILIAVGRLSSDSELIALRSSGISLFSLYRPILLVSLLLGGLNLYLMLEVLPVGNQALERLRIEIATQSLTEEVKPRSPYTKIPGRVLFVFESPPGEKLWRGVFFGDSSGGSEQQITQNQITIAERGRAVADQERGRVVMSLENAHTHQVNLERPRDYHLGFHRVTELSMETDRIGPAAVPTSIKRSMRSMSLGELFEVLRDPAAGEHALDLARVEVHKKFSIPMASLVFGLLALPLGFSNKRGGRSSGFAVSLGVILVYYVILNWGEETARSGEMPAWLAMWLANLLLLAGGLFLLTRRNSDKSLVLSRFDQWVQEVFWTHLLHARRRREEARKERRQAVSGRRRARADLVLRVPRLQLRFPNQMDRYVLGAYLKVLLIAALSGCLLYIIADLSDQIDEIMENGIAREVVIEYYQYKSFAIVYQIAPIIVLVTTLITFGLLSRTNEVTAAKALGMSLYRLSVPVVLAASVIALVAGLLQSEVLAASNSRVAELEAQIKGEDRSGQRFQRPDARWLGSRSGDRYMLYNFGRYDAEHQVLHRLQVLRFDDQYRLTSRLFADRAAYVESDWWVFSSGWSVTFEGSDGATVASKPERFTAPRRARLPEPPEFFSGDVRQPEEMRYVELRDYIDELREVGAKNLPQLQVALHNKVAYPVISLVMALVALPFAFRLGRRGALYGIGLALVLGIVLMVVLAFFSALGETGALPPLVAVWAPAAVFSIFSLYLFLGVRT